MKPRNYYIYLEDQEKLKVLKEEYISIGFDVELEKGRLIVFARNRKLKSRKQKAREARAKKSNRSGSKDGRETRKER